MAARFLRRGGRLSIRQTQHNLSLIFKACCIFLLLTALTADAAKVEDFIPEEIFYYLKLQDLDEVYNEIEISENWEKALTLFSGTPDWENIQQGLATFQGLLSTDLLNVIETVGYRTVYAAWLDESNTSQSGIVIHSGGNLDRLRQLTKITSGLLALDSANTLRLDAGVYQRVRYNLLEYSQNLIIKYGFVDDLLVIGIGEGSFEKLMDTYRTDLPSIRQNRQFTRALKETGTGEVTAFVTSQPFLPVLSDLGETFLSFLNLRHLTVLKSVFGKLSFLETGPFLQLTAVLNPDRPEDDISAFLKTGHKLETLKTLSAETDLFFAVAPNVLEGAWDITLAETQKNATPDTYEGIAFLEGLLNLNMETDILAGLTGELALSVPDITIFNPEALSDLNLEFDGTFEVDADNAEVNGLLIFNPSNRMKWNQIGNSLSNLQNASISQTDYKGVTVSGFASSIYYSEIDGLFLMGFSEDQTCALIDALKQRKKPGYLKRLPKKPTAVLQLNLARALEIEKGAPPAEKLLVDSKDIPLLLAWLSVEDDTASLEVTLSEKEPFIETLAKLVPFLLWNMDVEWETTNPEQTIEGEQQ